MGKRRIAEWVGDASWKVMLCQEELRQAVIQVEANMLQDAVEDAPTSESETQSLRILTYTVHLFINLKNVQNAFKKSF